MSTELKYDKNNIQIYRGDNQEVLESTKSNSIKLIYCDILYNSGKTFDDYNDNLGSPKEAVEWYRPRFEEMYRVLAEDGSIYIHCNWRLDSYMRILLDEIFGVENFRNRIYRKHSETRGFVENYDSQMDTILYYTKNKNNFTFNEIEGTKLRTVALFENGHLEGRSFDFRRGRIRFRGMTEDKHWLVNRKKLEELHDAGELVSIDGLPYRQTYVIPMGNLWDEDDMLDKYSRVDTAETYDTPKPNGLLERIIKVSSNEGDLVADFFLGGGTTAVEVVKLGRRGLFCDISEKACNVTIAKIVELLKTVNMGGLEGLLDELKSKLEAVESEAECIHITERDDGYFSGQISILEELIPEIEKLI